MRGRNLALSFLLALAVAAAALQARAQTSQPFKSVIDLTHPIGSHTPGFEPSAHPLFRARNVASYEKDGYVAREITVPEHFSTHIDAPVHFARGQQTVDRIPPERLIAPLVVLDVRNRARDNTNYLVSRGDIDTWERLHGTIPPGAVVMALTGWSSRWNNAAAYRNADERGTMHFPGFGLAAARFLVESRKVAGLGIDTLSIDPGTSTDFPVHKYLGSMSVYGLEEVANLERAPQAGAFVIVAPAMIEGGSGAPARIFAVVR